MDLLSDIPDFVRSEICCPSGPVPTGSSSSAAAAPTETPATSPFWQKWNELGLVVEKCIAPETSFQELTLRDLLASLPLNSIQATDANGFWSSTAFPSNFKFTTHPHFMSTTMSAAARSTNGILFVLESPCVDVHVQKQIVKLPRITNAATFVFLLQHFQLQSSECLRVDHIKQPHNTRTPSDMAMDCEGPSNTSNEDEDADEGVVNVTYSAMPMTSQPSSVTPMDAGIVKAPPSTSSSSSTSSVDIDSILERWRRGETHGRTGKPTVEKIAEIAGISQLDLKKWLSTKGTTWTQTLIKHGFRDGGK